VFVATGQTGIAISGWGIAVDHVISDYIAGAAERLVREGAERGDLLFVEGQGSLYHPGYSGVTLGLLHGAQPDALVMCHEPTRSHMRGLPNRPLPDIAACIAANEQAARLTNPQATCIGVCVNTSGLGRDAADTLLAALQRADRQTYSVAWVDLMAGGSVSGRGETKTKSK